LIWCFNLIENILVTTTKQPTDMFFNCKITIFFDHFSFANSKSKNNIHYKSLEKTTCVNICTCAFHISYFSYTLFFSKFFFFCLSFPFRSHLKTVIFRSKIDILSTQYTIAVWREKRVYMISFVINDKKRNLTGRYSQCIHCWLHSSIDIIPGYTKFLLNICSKRKKL
jgi:hypothetical protein